MARRISAGEMPAANAERSARNEAANTLGHVALRAPRGAREKNFTALRISRHWYRAAGALKHAQITDECFNFGFAQKRKIGHARFGDAVANGADQFCIGVFLNLAGSDIRAALASVSIEAVATGAGGREGLAGFGETSGVRRFWLGGRWRGLSPDRAGISDQSQEAKSRRQQ